MNEKFYNEIKNILNMARNKVYKTANFAMVEAYWNIGKSIIEEQGGNEKAEYGTGLLKELSKQMTQDFGKGFTVTNLKYMRQFYLMFPNGHALRDELSWTHYRLLIKVENDNAREFYMQEAVKSQWSTRQLERQMKSFLIVLFDDCPVLDGQFTLSKLANMLHLYSLVGIILVYLKLEAGLFLGRHVPCPWRQSGKAVCSSLSFASRRHCRYINIRLYSGGKRFDA